MLTSLNSAMLSAQTLIQKANNSAMGSEERSAIASELEGLQKQMFDLMNSKNSQGSTSSAAIRARPSPSSRMPVATMCSRGTRGSATSRSHPRCRSRPTTPVSICSR